MNDDLARDPEQPLDGVDPNLVHDPSPSHDPPGVGVVTPILKVVQRQDQHQVVVITN